MKHWVKVNAWAISFNNKRGPFVMNSPPFSYSLDKASKDYSDVFFPKSGSTLMNAVTAKVMAQRNMTRMKKEL